MKIEYPGIVTEELYPGYFVSNYTPLPFSTDGGTVVPPGVLIVPPEVPANFLRLLADAKDGGKPATPAPPAPPPPPPPPLNDGAPTLAERITNALANSGGKARLGELAETLGVTPDEIKALDGQGFTVGRAGWVSLNEGGEA